MANSWVKLHLQTLDNDIYLHDPTAWRIFEYLLMRAYNGKPQGTVSTTRQQIAGILTINNGTVYSALSRLKKAKMITASSTTNKTLIRICNWHNFQGAVNSPINNAATMQQQSSNTLIRIENKKVSKDTNVELIFDLYREAFKSPKTLLTPGRQRLLAARLKDCGPEMLRQAIQRTAASDFHRGDNDRNWKADLDFIIRKPEQVERLSHLEVKVSNVKRLMMEEV